MIEAREAARACGRVIQLKRERKMSKNAPWTKLDPGSCAWAKAKQLDTTMSDNERAYVLKRSVECGLGGKKMIEEKPQGPGRVF